MTILWVESDGDIYRYSPDIKAETFLELARFIKDCVKPAIMVCGESEDCWHWVDYGQVPS